MAQSRQYRIGLVLSAVLAAVDVLSVGAAGADDGPPVAVIGIGFLLGIITLVGVWLAWRGDERGFMTVVVSRMLSALLGVPAFFADEAPDWAPAAVGIAIMVSIVALWLLFAGRRRGAQSA